MPEPFRIDFSDGATATAVRVAALDKLPEALTALGLVPPRPVLVVVGGAGGLGDSDVERLRALFVEAIVPVISDQHAIGIDGGTLSGVMKLFGESRVAAEADFPLVGVVAEGTVRLPGSPESNDAADLDPRHSHFVIVPGTEWGDESPWIARVATVLAADAPSITVLINGGAIAMDDVERSMDAGREVVVIEGSGRAADELAAALTGLTTGTRAADVAGRFGIRSLPVGDPAALARSLSEVFGGRSDPPDSTAQPRQGGS